MVALVIVLVFIGYGLCVLIGFAAGKRVNEDLVMITTEEIRDIVLEALFADKKAFITASIEDGTYGSDEYYEALKRKQQLIAMALRT